jgi:hypothetical protein
VCSVVGYKIGVSDAKNIDEKTALKRFLLFSRNSGIHPSDEEISGFDMR